ncbi:MAG: mechanosensitive ion channel family protein [Xenococcaceae cyanobacterium]
MKKKWQSLIALALLMFLIVAATPLAYSQEKAAPENHIDGVPVIIADETLFIIQANVGSFSAEERAQAITNRIETIAKDASIQIDNLQLEDQGDATNIILGKKVIVTLTEADAKAARQVRQELAIEYRQKIKDFIKQYREERSLPNLLFAVLYTFLSTLSLIIVVIILNKTFPRIYNQIDSWRETRVPPLRIQNIEILPATRIADILISLAKLIYWVMVLGIFYVYIPLVLSFFPWTKRLGENLFSHLVSTVELFLEKLVDYLPNLFAIGLIIFITYYIIRFFQLIFTEVDRGNISLPRFYPEWAQPTYKLATFLIIALAAVVAFPYLPGAGSPAFQGVSLFLGLLLSLGSTAAVANAVAGIILIYTRAFQIGDHVKIADATGNIAEKTLLVTRIRTPKNVVITIPNIAVLSSNVVNFSTSARDASTPLILHTTITLGYDVPWRKVHQVLIEAAGATQHILEEPAPFVLQTSLDDFYVSYELNVYTNQPSLMSRIYSELHQNIQDKCNSSEIEILSPHYSAVRDGNQNTIPENYLPKGYTPPGFRISPLGYLFNQPNQQQPSEGDE